jgi:hypothetical protein
VPPPSRQTSPDGTKTRVPLKGGDNPATKEVGAVSCRRGSLLVREDVNLAITPEKKFGLRSNAGA